MQPHSSDKRHIAPLIFLIGFMGSGKTYLGSKLAMALGFDFVDLDALLEQQERKTIASIFSDEGEEVFRKKEAMVLRTMAGRQHAVIATGGGAPCFHDNMKWMNEQGLTVFLNASVDTLCRRLGDEVNSRPMLAGKKGEGLRSFIQSKLQERLSFYSKAMLTVNAECIDAASLRDALNRYL